MIARSNSTAEVSTTQSAVPNNRSSVIVSLVLAVVVLGLFLRLQEYGPESALRKFHQALTGGSLRQLQNVTEEDINSPEVQDFAGRVQRLLRIGGNRFRILRTDRQPSEVRAVVAYNLPNGQTPSIVWVVDRQGKSWKVSVTKTRQVLREAFGLY